VEEMGPPSVEMGNNEAITRGVSQLDHLVGMSKLRRLVSSEVRKTKRKQLHFVPSWLPEAASSGVQRHFQSKLGRSEYMKKYDHKMAVRE
jgi:hypothetical protein